MRKYCGFFIVVMIVGITFRGGSTHAQYSSTTDCALLGNADPALYAQSVVKSLAQDSKPELLIFTDDDMGVALSHMKQYCCNQNLIAKGACEGVERGEPYYPQSPYIFDHLLYVGMKKMDGIQEHCDVLGISCETRTYDVNPVERREEITTIAEDTNGYAPGYILALFAEYRGLPDTYADSSEKTLLKAYDRLCQDAVNIRYAVNVPPDIIQDQKQGLGNLAQLCEIATQERYAREAAYVRTLQIEKGTKFVVDNLKAYLNEYFINKRMADLVGKYGELDACFNMVSRFVDKTAQCNQ